MVEIKLKANWLNQFKAAVQEATNSRLNGNIGHAMVLDSTIDGYYKEAKINGYYNEDDLFEIESDIRAEGLNEDI